MSEEQIEQQEVVEPSEQPVEETPPVAAEDKTPSLDDLREKAAEVSDEQPSEAPIEPSTEEQTKAYEPDLTYKVSGEDKEFDPWVKDLIKDKETEDHFRKLYADAAGLSVVKEKYEAQANEFKTTQEELQNWHQTRDVLAEQVRRGDFRAFFKELNIPQERVYEWVLQEAKLKELPEEERRVYNERMELARERDELARQNQGLSSEMQQNMVRQREFEIDQALQKPEVSQFMQSYDAKVGRVGAFRDRVWQHGLGVYYATGKDMEPNEVIQDLLQISQVGQPQAAPPQEAGQPVENRVVAIKPKPVIPNIGDAGTSPVRKSPKSLDDLRKIAESM